MHRSVVDSLLSTLVEVERTKLMLLRVIKVSRSIVQEKILVSVSLDSSEVRSDDRVTLSVLQCKNSNLLVISNALDYVTVIGSVYSYLALCPKVSRGNVECLVDVSVATSTSILSVEADELIVISIGSHLSVRRIQEIGSSQVRSVCRSTISCIFSLIFVEVTICINLFEFNLLSCEIISSEVECLDTIIVESRAEYQALQMSEESNHNGILLSALHIVEVQIVIVLHSSDCARSKERNICSCTLILFRCGIVGVLVELASLGIGNIVITVQAVNTVLTVFTVLTVLTIFTVQAVFTVLTIFAVQTVFTVLTIFTIFANSFVIGLRSVLIPKTVITDSPGVTIFAISTVFTIGNLEIAAIAGEDLHTISDRLHIGEVVAFTDGVVNLTDCRGKIVDLFL